MLTKEKGYQSSYQVKDYLLCAECEHRFNVNGESYVMQLVSTPEIFPLLDVLSKVNTKLKTDEWRAYLPKDTPGIDRAKLAYFAISVFWRASVHTWRQDDGELIRITFGTKYNEEIRTYLMGGPMPVTASLYVVVCTDKLNQQAFFLPEASSKPHNKLVGFLARGINFSFGIGKSVPDFHRRLSMINAPYEVITTYDCTKHPLWELGPKMNAPT